MPASGRVFSMIRHDRGREEKPVQRREGEQHGHQRQLDREDDAVLGLDQRAKTAELNDRKPSPVSTSNPTSGTQSPRTA